MGWTSNSGRYAAKRWWCGVCQQRTLIELNPDWVAVGKPLQWEGGPSPWSWFTRCSYCQTRQHDEGEGSCPRCGTPSEPSEGPEWPGTMLEATKPKYNITYSLNYGVTGYDWEERHRCRKCGHKYWFTNSSC